MLNNVVGGGCVQGVKGVVFVNVVFFVSALRAFEFYSNY